MTTFTTTLAPGRDDIDVITVKGELDAYTAAEFRQVLARLRDEGRYSAVIDLTGCTYLDSYGLAVMTGALKHARAHDTRVAVACDGEPILRVFRITGMNKVLAIAATVTEALALITPAPEEGAP